MKYKYRIRGGAAKIKTNTRKYAGGILVSLGIVSAMAVPVIAAQPAAPGCFGKARSAEIKVMTGRAWGEQTAALAGENGTLNKEAEKTACGI